MKNIHDRNKNRTAVPNVASITLHSNQNRRKILHLLKHAENNQMQAELISKKLGVSHRTALYHLDIMEQCGAVKVRRYRRRGTKFLRSVWGLNRNNDELIDKLFKGSKQKI